MSEEISTFFCGLAQHTEGSNKQHKSEADLFILLINHCHINSPVITIVKPFENGQSKINVVGALTEGVDSKRSSAYLYIVLLRKYFVFF